MHIYLKAVYTFGKTGYKSIHTCAYLALISRVAKKKKK